MSSTKVELVEPNHPQAGDNKFETVDEASAFLKDAARSKLNLTHFLSVWEQGNPARTKGTAHQEKIRMFRELASRLANGKLRLRHEHKQVGGVTAADEPASEARAPRQSWDSGAQLRLRDRPDRAPPPPPEPPTNVKQQVDALKQAANSGAPFCKRCQEPASEPNDE